MAIHVINISWTRTFFQVDYITNEPADQELFLFNTNTHQFVSFDNTVTSVQEGSATVQACLNIAIANERAPLAAGEWVLCAKIDSKILQDEQKLFKAYPYLEAQVYTYLEDRTPLSKQGDKDRLWADTHKRRFDVVKQNPYDVHSVSYDDDVLEKLDSLAQVFRYADGLYVYTASVIPRVDASDYCFVVLYMDFYVRNSNPQVRKGSLRFKEKQILAEFASLEAKRFKHSGRRVLFLKENADWPSSNMAAVRDRMLERGLDKEFEIIEHYRNTFGAVRQSPKEWLEDISEIVRADYIFIDDYCPVFGFIKPAQGAVLTQLWHAGVGFKSVGYARFGIEGSPDPYHSPHRMYDYAVVGNKYLRDIYSEVFGIEPQALLATGMPRLDHFLDESVAQAAKIKFYQAYPWMESGRVIMFAPTFRGLGQRQAYYPYQEFFDFDELHAMCVASNSYFVFEMHGFIKEPPPIPQEYQDRIFDLSHESLDELYHVSDVLVTDYSSCFYDYLLLQKPVVFYTPDRVVYSVTRGVQRPINEFAPGIVCDTFDNFMETLINNAYEGFEPHPSCIDRALERGALASDRVIDTVLFGKDVPGVRYSE